MFCKSNSNVKVFITFDMTSCNDFSLTFAVKIADYVFGESALKVDAIGDKHFHYPHI